METDNLTAQHLSYGLDRACDCSAVPSTDRPIDRILDHLADLSSGLLFMSESDYPFDIFLWPQAKHDRPTPERVLCVTGHPRGTPIEETTLDDFFRPAVEDREGQTDEERARVQRFRALVDGIRADLSDVHVYRVGAIAIDVYIIGRAPDGTLVGLHTKVIET
jgi:hypothetical protein